MEPELIKRIVEAAVLAAVAQLLNDVELPPADVRASRRVLDAERL